MHFVLNKIVNLAPFPSSLLHVTLPPIYSIICLQIESPRPVPPLFCSEFSSSFPKSLKSYFNPSFEMPFPLSIMLISYRTNFSFSCSLILKISIDLAFLVGTVWLMISSSWIFKSKELNYTNLSLLIYCSWFILIMIVIFPLAGVNFNELDMKFNRIYLIRLLSP